MRINCIGCGHRFDLGDEYCDYEGLLRCPTCAVLLNVKTEDGLIRRVMPGSFETAPTSVQPDPAPVPDAATQQPASPAPAPQPEAEPQNKAA